MPTVASSTTWRERRAAAGLKQHEVAAKLGVPPVYLTAVEVGLDPGGLIEQYKALVEQQERERAAA